MKSIEALILAEIDANKVDLIERAHKMTKEAIIEQQSRIETLKWVLEAIKEEQEIENLMWRRKKK